MKQKNEQNNKGMKGFFDALKLLAGIFAFVLCAAPIPAYAAEIVSSGTGDDSSQTWTLDSDGILRLTGSGEWTGFSSAFNDVEDKVESLVVCDGITALDCAVDCDNLRSVEFADSVKEIGSVFVGCESLASVKLPAHISEIKKNTFYGCSSLLSITIPDGVETIGEGAFYDCTSLLKVDIPDSVKSIEIEAFWNCKELSLTIPSGTKLNGFAFNKLKSLTFENGDDIPDATVYQKGLVYIYSSEGRTDGDWGPETLTIKSGGANGSGSFKGATRLKKIIFENGVTEIHTHFYGTGVTEISIPDSVTQIGRYVFYGCNKLTTVSGGKNVTLIDRGAFSMCTSLSKFTGFQNLKEIGTYAFNKCTNLKSITIPSKVSTISELAFNGCVSLSEVKFPAALKEIGPRAFFNCPKLKSVTIPKSVTTIGAGALGFYFQSDDESKGTWEKCKGFKIYGYKDTAAEDYADKYTAFTFVDLDALPVGTKITNKKTGGVYKVTKADQEVAYLKPISKKKTSVTIPATIKVNGKTLKVTSVAKKAFYGNKKIKKVTIGTNVKTIGASAFANCTSLKTVVEKATGLTTIGEKAFSGDTKLATITLKTKKLKKVGAQAFRKIKSNAVIRVPSSRLKAYEKLLSGKGQGKNVKIKKI